MKKRKSTMVELVTELEAVQPRTRAVEQLIAEAKTGEYHDYKNNKYACGKIAAYSKLQKAGLYSLANRVRDGEFDEEPDDEDKAAMRRDVEEGCSSPEEAAKLKGILGL